MIKLSAKPRENRARALRREGMIPAILYGYNQENTPICVDEKEFNKVYKKAGDSSLINLNLGKKVSVVLVYETQYDPATGNIMHIDFYQPNLKEKVEADIPLLFEGESPAVKDMEGTLVKSMTEVTVSALPESLPHEIVVDISALQTFDDVIKIEDLKVPKDVEIVNEGDWTVAMVSAPENVEEQLEQPIDEGVDKVEVVDEKKEEDGEE